MKKKFKVTGMSCAACQNNVTKAVERVKGVRKVTVSLLTNSMEAEWDEPADEEKIIAAVTRVGYGIGDIDANIASLDDDETKKLTIRLIVSAVVLLLLMYVSMGFLMWDWPLFPFLARNPLLIAISEFILSGAILILNRHFFISGFKGIIHRATNMDALISLGSGSGFVYSVGVILFVLIGQMQNNDLVAAWATVKALYFESSAMILVLISVGELLNAISKGKTKNAIRSLLKLAPKTARLIREGDAIVVAVAEVRKGDIFKVLPGESVPVDGIVINGKSAVDESLLTGESLPVDKDVGSEVRSGTLNNYGALTCRATRVGEDASLNQIIKLVSDASASKAPVGRIADKAAGVFVPVVISLAAITLVVWLLIGHDLGFSLTRAITVLVISCPCALGLATPLSIMAGNGKGARNGILYKSAESLEEIGKTRVAVFDKTGTLTQGKVKVTDILPAKNYDKETLLRYAAAVEANSEHPLAKAIVSYAEEQKITIDEVIDFTSLPGMGVQAIYNGKVIVGGKEIKAPAEYEKNVAEYEAQGKTPLFFAYDNEFLGIIAVADIVKEDAAEAVRQLKNLGLEVVMLTGDNEKTARVIADKAGISRVVANVLPAKKSEVVKRLGEQLGPTMMVGDGVNDAPALTSASVGVAIGAGSDVAIEAADVVLEKSTLVDVPASVRLSRRTLRNIKQSLTLALIYNAFGIPLAAGVFIPLGLVLNPMIASLMHSIFSLSVVSNGLRMNLVKIYDAENDKPLKIKKAKKEEISREIVFRVNGMGCEKCVAKVRNALESVDGVKEASVDLATGMAKAKIIKDIAPSVLREAIIASGYGAEEYREENEISLQISGMGCEKCVAKVKNALESVDGVKEASVDLATGVAKAKITKDIAKGVLIAAIEKAGYRAE